MQEKYSGAIYIIGPGNENSYEKELEFLNAQFKKVVVIGDGKMNILDKNNEGPLQNLKTLNQDYPELLNEGKILVYIDAHGTAEENGHYIQVNKGGELLPSKRLFEVLAENINKPMDIIFIPCNGKTALTDISVLPLDSRVIIFSDPEADTLSTNIIITLEAIANDEFSLDNFYNNYLARIFSMQESPVVSINGKEAIDPAVLSKIYLGKTISEPSRQYVHDNFGQSVCTTDISCYDKIYYLMNKIEQTSSIEEFRVIAGKRYFITITEFAQLESDYAFIRNTHHERDVIYNHKESEHCYKEVLDLKNKADQLFLARKIALELDLSDKDLYEIDYDYLDDNNDIKEYVKTWFDIGIYNFFKGVNGGFVENNNFAKPEYEEYGFVLGIIKDIHLSLSLVGDIESV